eukprot:3016901-Amphidinium_carterae.1
MFKLDLLRSSTRVRDFGSDHAMYVILPEDCTAVGGGSSRTSETGSQLAICIRNLNISIVHSSHLSDRHCYSTVPTRKTAKEEFPNFQEPL